MLPKHSRLVAIASVALFVGAAACTVNSTDSSDAGSSSGSSGSSGNTAKDSGTDAGDSGETLDCTKTTTLDDCISCCSPESALAKANAAADTCACAAGCSTNPACTTYCQNPNGNPPEACVTCLDSTGSCQDEYDTACAADPLCQAGRACQTASSCVTKGADAGDGG